MEAPNDATIMRVLNEIRSMGVKTHYSGSNYERINMYILWFNNKIKLSSLGKGCFSQYNPTVERVVVLVIYNMRAYSSLPKRKDDCAGETDMGSPEYNERLRDQVYTREHPIQDTAIIGHGNVLGHNVVSDHATIYIAFL